MDFHVTTTYYEPQSEEEAIELRFRRQRAIRLLVELAREKKIRANASDPIIRQDADSESFSSPENEVDDVPNS